jgi:putative ABC transport system permease protein
MMQTLWQDLRYALRMFARNPGFAAFAVAVLALGIGANTAIFSVAYNVLLRPLPYRDARRLVMVWEESSAFGFPEDTPAPGNFFSWKSENHVFEDMAAIDDRTFNLTGEGDPQELQGKEITANMFPLLGVQPALGRNISPEEDKPGAGHVALLSHGLWLSNFGGDPKVLGKEIWLNGAKFTVIGVMPQGFLFPDRETKIWVPMAFSDSQMAVRDTHYLNVVARLRKGVSLDQTNADLAIIARRLAEEFPASNAKVGAYAEPLRNQLAGNSRQATLVLLGAVAFVLLIACANVANLMLARAAGRQRELAMRMTLGAGRMRIIRQLLTESILLSGLAGGAGLLLSLWATQFLANLIPSGIAPISGSGVNAPVLGFLGGVSILTGLLFGVAPALRVSRLNLTAAMKQGGGRSGVGSGGTRVRDLLVVAEVALALVLFSGATLMLRSLLNLRGLDPGFRPDHVLALTADLPFPKYKDVTRRNEFWDAVLDRVSHLPGVVAAGCTTWLPLTNSGGASGITIEGRPEPKPGDIIIPNFRMISSEYVQAMGMKLIAGRLFDEREGAKTQPVALINQTVARRYWPGEDPVGKRFKDGGYSSSSPWITIVGVVGDIRQEGLDVPPRPEVYFPFGQHDSFAPSYLAVRTAGDPMGLANSVREQVWAVDRDQSVTGVMPLETMLDDYLAPRKLQSSLLGGFAGFALLLAALGIYAVLSFSVMQRTQEIGMRVALGAQQRGILRVVLGQGLRLAIVGVVIGLAGALALGRVISNLLFGVSAFDPLTLAEAVAALLAVSFTACYVPARRAMRTDPMVALRYE